MLPMQHSALHPPCSGRRCTRRDPTLPAVPAPAAQQVLGTNSFLCEHQTHNSACCQTASILTLLATIVVLQSLGTAAESWWLFNQQVARTRVYPQAVQAAPAPQMAEAAVAGSWTRTPRLCRRVQRVLRPQRRRKQEPAALSLLAAAAAAPLLTVRSLDRPACELR